VKDFVCLFFDADGIVRATDTVVAENLEEATKKAHALLDILTSLDRVELWSEGRRVYRSNRR
jgi:hypothetical protein